jgi:hypothetical protein
MFMSEYYPRLLYHVRLREHKTKRRWDKLDYHRRYYVERTQEQGRRGERPLRPDEDDVQEDSGDEISPWDAIMDWDRRDLGGDAWGGGRGGGDDGGHGSGRVPVAAS